MHPKAAALMEAHTRHVMEQLAGDNLSLHIQNETLTFCAWLGTRPVHTLVDEVRARDFILRNILEAELSPELRQQVRDVIKQGIKSPLNKETRIEHVLNVKEYDDIVERLVVLEDARRDIIRAVLNNPAYSDFLSDLLFQNIKDYLLEDNLIAKKVPGASSLMKLGKGVFDKVGGGLENAMESTLKSYIQRNIRKTIEMSEQMVNRALATPKLRTVARQFWHRVKDVPLSTASKYVKDADVDASADIINTLWNHLRQTPYARQLTTELVHAWYEQWGDRPAMAVLTDLGYTPERLTEELRQILTPYIEAMRETGFLELRVRAYLEPFYTSDSVTSVLES